MSEPPDPIPGIGSIGQPSPTHVVIEAASPTPEQNYSATDGLPLRRISRMTPDGRWVWAWQSAWQLDADN